MWKQFAIQQSTTSAGIQRQSAKSNATTKEKQTLECDNASIKWQKIRFMPQTPCNTNPSPVNQSGGMICSIIWQSNSISTVKTFATPKKRHVCQRQNCNSQA